jgi:hypothetical protein
MTIQPVFPISRKDLKKYSSDFKLEAIIADGMWYSLPKWRKLSKVSEVEIQNFIGRNLNRGRLVQSKTGAKSFRYTYRAVLDWHARYGIKVGEPIFDFIFPARVWDRQTEVDGFNNAPLRDVGIITFECTATVMSEVRLALLGVAKIRSAGSGRYKAYCLSARYVKEIIQEVFDRHTISEASRIYSRSSSMRRELCDFSPRFAEHLILFYKGFARSLLKKEMETVRIYLPDPADQNAQILEWVITAIEKFDEASSVPFSGYLNAVLKRWPYDLPNHYLGKDLSIFQRDRSRAIKILKTRVGDASFTSEQLASELGMKLVDFLDLEEKHHIWIHTKNASTLNWGDSGEEKQITDSQSEVDSKEDVKSEIADYGNIIKANELSTAIIHAALKSGNFDDAYMIISQVDAGEIDPDIISKTSPMFIRELGAQLGIS